MSCEAAESIEDALLRMVRVNCNHLLRLSADMRGQKGSSIYGLEQKM